MYADAATILRRYARTRSRVKGANRLVQVRRPSDNGEIATYGHDALGRRVQKHVANSGVLDTIGGSEFYYYDGGRIIELHRPTAHEHSDCVTYTCGGPSGKTQNPADQISAKVIDNVYVETKVSVTAEEVNPRHR